MRIRSLSFLAFLFAAQPLCSVAQQAAGTAATEPSAAQKWLTQVSTQFDEAYEKTVLAPYKEGLESARKAYQTAIESGLQSVSGAGQEAEAALLREERERFFSAGRMVPTEPNNSALVQEARNKFRTQITALDKARLEKARPLHAKFDAALVQNITLLKQRQLAADAALLTAKREEIAREWLQPPASAAGPEAKEEKIAPLTHMGLKESIQWLLENDARIRYKAGKKQMLLKDPKQLPSGHVEFTEVRLEAPEKSGPADNKRAELQARDLDRLAPLRGIHSLQVVGYPLSDESFTFLDAWKEMEQFMLVGALVTDKLAVKLARFPMLTSLFVSRCGKLTPDFIHQLAPVLPKLEELNLSYTDVGDQAVDDIVSFKRLTDLNLRSTRITDQGLARLASMKTLRLLEVRDTKVTAAGLGCLANLKLTSLGFLSTDSPNFAADAAQIAKMLPKLEGLALSGSEFRAEHVEALAAFRELHSLSIPGMSPKTEGLSALQKLKNLESFSCTDSSSFGDDELGALAENKHLKQINLAQTSVTNAGLLKLAKNKDIKHLNVINTGVTEAGVEALEKAIRGIHVVR